MGEVGIHADHEQGDGYCRESSHALRGMYSRLATCAAGLRTSGFLRTCAFLRGLSKDFRLPSSGLSVHAAWKLICHKAGAGPVSRLKPS